jgi:hypothetical protein
VVRDGSGSMLGDYGDLVPDDIATSLAILFAEQLTGEFKDTFITFSKNPKIVKIAGETIKDKCDNLFKYADPTNTDIKKVYQLILDVYKNPNFRKEDALDSIEDAAWEIYDQGKDEYFGFEDRVKEALIDERQKEIDKLSDINDSINDTNSKLLDSMQQQLDAYRQTRDNEKTEQEISDKQRRLSYLSQDTSGANALEIK